jgi:hypothetical protein
VQPAGATQFPSTQTVPASQVARAASKVQVAIAVVQQPCANSSVEQRSATQTQASSGAAERPLRSETTSLPSQWGAGVMQAGTARK